MPSPAKREAILRHGFRLTEKVGEGQTEGMDECPLCEEKKGEEHGYIYLGDGAEHVYRCISDPTCAECDVHRSDCTPENPVCDCEVEVSE